MKVATILGTRPEIIKLSRVIYTFDNYLEHFVINTNQNFDKKLNANFFEELGLKKPKYNLSCSDNNFAKTLSNIISKVDEVLENEKPDAILIYGDTHSGLSAIVAKKKKIPIFHMEAGNRCFDNNVPEEINRKIIDHLSDINIVLTENARNYLISEGFPQHKIFNVGSFVPEISIFYKKNINKSKIMNKLKLYKSNYILASIHREENLDINDYLSKIMYSLNQLSITSKKKIIFSTHPRTKTKLLNNRIKFDPKKIILSDPFGYFDYIKLAKNSFITISDSGTIVEDCATYGFKAIMLRDTNERPEGFDNGNLIMVSPNSNNLIKAVDVLKLKKSDENLNQYSDDIYVT
tara:strand:- start:29 stop:1075 length:1047 start_codon:yes stop_codon:yes gene_type:complete